MRKRKTKKDLVKSWLEKARRDLITAKISLSSKEPFSDIICFHAQQSVEKYIKAYLIWLDMEFPKTHSLEDLLILAAQEDKNIFRYLKKIESLTPYAVEVRYPEIEQEPSMHDARKAIAIAEEIEKSILNRLRLVIL